MGSGITEFHKKKSSGGKHDRGETCRKGNAERKDEIISKQKKGEPARK